MEGTRCPSAAIPAAQVLYHVCKSYKDTSDGLTVNSSPGRLIFSICLSFIQKYPSKRSPRWVVYKLGRRWRAVPASRLAAEVETAESPDTSPTRLYHITLPTSLTSCEAEYSHSNLLLSFPNKVQQWGNLRPEKQFGGMPTPKLTPDLDLPLTIIFVSI